MARFIIKRKRVDDSDTLQRPRPHSSQLQLQSTASSPITRSRSRAAGLTSSLSSATTNSSQSQSSEDQDEMELSVNTSYYSGKTNSNTVDSDFDDSSLSDRSYLSSSDDDFTDDDDDSSEDIVDTPENEKKNTNQQNKQFVKSEKPFFDYDFQVGSVDREYELSSRVQQSEESDSSDYDYDFNQPDISDPDWDESCDYKLEFPNVVPDDQYNPEHPFVRSRIDGVYYELCGPKQFGMSTSDSSTTSTSVSGIPCNIQQVVDNLIQTHLPQFWRHREQDKDLNRFSGLTAQNSRPHQHALLVTCVDCGYKFHKQPLYESPATERQDQRKAREHAVNNENFNRRRSPWKERKPIKAVDLFKRLNGEPIRSDSFSQSEIHDILNNNRKSKSYDGNMDYIGLKDEGHPADCPSNRSSKKHVTKLHFGWELVIGHDHSVIPTFPRQIIRRNLESRGSYYPARSLMASFTHILPRGQTLPQNQIRKLFAYFIWHRWFDCDLQAITLRKAYTELWPLFMLRDEEPGLTSQEITEFRKSGASKKRSANSQLHANSQAIQQPNKDSLSFLKSEFHDSSSDKSSVTDKRDLTPEQRAAKERARLLSMEQRCTTLLNIGLMNHGVDTESRHLSVQERVRKEKEVGKGWVLGFSGHLKNEAQNLEESSNSRETRKASLGDSHKVKVAHKIHEYTARVKDIPTAGNNPLVQRLTNPEFTRPNEPDALKALTLRLEQLSKRADARRKQSGFTLPEYMVPEKMKDKVIGSRIWFETKTSKRRKLTSSARESDISDTRQETSQNADIKDFRPSSDITPSAILLTSQPSNEFPIEPLHSVQDSPHLTFRELKNNEMAFETLEALEALDTIAFPQLNSISPIVHQNAATMQVESYHLLDDSIQTPLLFDDYGINMSYDIDFNVLMDNLEGTANQSGIGFQTYNESTPPIFQSLPGADLGIGMTTDLEQINPTLIDNDGGKDGEDIVSTETEATSSDATQMIINLLNS